MRVHSIPGKELAQDDFYPGKGPVATLVAEDGRPDDPGNQTYCRIPYFLRSDCICRRLLFVV